MRSLTPRRYVCFLLVVMLTVLSYLPGARAINPQPEPPGIEVFIDGGRLVSEKGAPFIQDGRTLVPLRAIFEALGAEVDWNGETQTVTAVKGSVTLQLTIGSRTALKNGSEVELDVPGFIVRGFTFVPLRFVSEALGAAVDYDYTTQKITIVSAAEPAPDEPEPPEVTPDEPETPGETAGPILPVLPDLERKFILPDKFANLSDGNRAILLPNGKLYPLLRLQELQLLNRMTPELASPAPQAVLDKLQLVTPAATVDLRDWQTPIRDQAGRNTCVSFAVVAAMEAKYRRQNPSRYDDVDLSEQYAHHVQKMVALKEINPDRADLRENAVGAWGFGGVKYSSALFNSFYGIPREQMLPYIAGYSYENTREAGDNPKLDWEDAYLSQLAVNAFNLAETQLPTAALADASYAISSYSAIPDASLKDVSYYEAVLAAGYEIVFTMGIYSPDPTPDDQVWNPGYNLEGYHAMVMVGYDDVRQVFIVKNSWGYDNAFEKGFTLVGYDYVTAGYVVEAVYITGVTDPNANQRPEQLLLGRWKLDHDGWKGTLDIYRHPDFFASSRLDGQADHRIGTYFHSDGNAYRVNGTISGNKVEFYIDFNKRNLEYGELQGKKFTGYLFTREPEFLAGSMRDTDSNVYGFYATRESYLTSTPVPGDIDYGSYVGVWDMNHDGWHGTLNISAVNRTNGTLTATYTAQDGRQLTVTGLVALDKHLIMFNLPFDTASPQPFVGYIHSWEPGIICGYTQWGGREFGFTAARRKPQLNIIPLIPIITN